MLTRNDVDVKYGREALLRRHRPSDDAIKAAAKEIERLLSPTQMEGVEPGHVEYAAMCAVAAANALPEMAAFMVGFYGEA